MYLISEVYGIFLKYECLIFKSDILESNYICSQYQLIQICSIIDKKGHTTRQKCFYRIRLKKRFLGFFSRTLCSPSIIPTSYITLYSFGMSKKHIVILFHSPNTHTRSKLHWWPQTAVKLTNNFLSQTGNAFSCKISLHVTMLKYLNIKNV